MGSLLSYFNGLLEDYREQKKIDKLFTCALSSISSRSNVRALALFLNTPFSRSQSDALLRKAIDTDNVEVFKTVLEHVAKNNLNHKLVQHFGMLGSGHSYYEEQSLLYLALVNEKQNIVLWLAEKPELDISNSGYHSKTVYHSGGFLGSGHTEEEKKYYDLPLTVAEKKNMESVIAVLANRTADLKVQEAMGLRAKAARHAPA